MIDICEESPFYLDKRIIKNKKILISLWGETNYFSEEKKIIDWIIKKTKDFHIRSGILEIVIDEKEKNFFMIYNSIS